MVCATTQLNVRDASVNTYSSVFQIGGVSVRIASDRENDVALATSLRAFCTDARRFDIDVRVEWKEELHQTHARQLFDSGSVWRLYDCEQGLQFDFTSASLGGQPYKRFLADREFRSAVLLMSKKAFARCCRSADPLDYPLDELLIMHRLTQEDAIELHGCGIVRADGTGNLFVGHSGAGKSTTTGLWTEREGVEILSDDRIIVRRDEPPAGSGEPAAIVRQRDRSASLAGHFTQDDKRNARDESKQLPPGLAVASAKPRYCIRMHGTPWHGEARYASPGNAPLARVFILEHGIGNGLTLLSPAQAIAELFARSFVPFYRHQYVDSALEFLQEVVSQVPCYRYAFEPNQDAVQRILELRD